MKKIDSVVLRNFSDARFCRLIQVKKNIFGISASVKQNKILCSIFMNNGEDIFTEIQKEVPPTYGNFVLCNFNDKYAFLCGVRDSIKG